MQENFQWVKKSRCAVKWAYKMHMHYWNDYTHRRRERQIFCLYTFNSFSAKILDDDDNDDDDWLACLPHVHHAGSIQFCKKHFG